MNHALAKLAADIQEVMRKNREMSDSVPDLATIHIPPYMPTDTIKRFDAEETMQEKHKTLR